MAKMVEKNLERVFIKNPLAKLKRNSWYLKLTRA